MNFTLPLSHSLDLVVLSICTSPSNLCELLHIVTASQSFDLARERRSGDTLNRVTLSSKNYSNLS